MSDSQLMTDAELNAIRERAERATPGPWVVTCGDDEYCSTVGGILPETELRRVEAEHDGRGDFPENTQWIVVDPGCAPVHLASGDNEEFIAHAREDVPRLLAEIDRLRDEVCKLM
jgi:hypothetical protein